MMTEREARMYAYALMESQGLTGWSFGFNNNRSRLGVCKYRTKNLEISRFHLHDSLEDIRNTIAHEVAHAIVGHGHGHNHVWRSKAMSIGCDGRRCGERMKSAPHRYNLVCKTHGVVGHMNRWSSKRRSCSRCSPRFNSAYLLLLVENK